jgi:UDP-N-acetyl-D-galactosamine dehydrogenase
VPELIRELEEFSINVDAIDPFADPVEFKEEYNIDMVDAPNKKYDAIVLAVNHQQYATLDESYLKGLSTEESLVYDVKGVFRGKITELKYLSL